MERWVVVLESGGVGGRAALDLATRVGDSFRILRVAVGPHATSRPGTLRVPVDRGSAPALLLGVFHTLARDADARVVVIPSEFSLDRSHTLLEAIDAASRTAAHALTTIHLVAACPPISTAPPHWLVPRHWGAGSWPSIHSVFPTSADASGMIEMGALADTGVLVAHAWTFASFMRERQYGWFQALRQAVQHPELVDEAFQALQPVDLFGDVLLPGLDHLRIVPARRRDSPTGLQPPEASCSANN